MQNDMKFLRRRVGEETIRASATSMKGAVAVTDTELITGRTGMFGWGEKIDRYPLSAVSKMRCTLNPHATLLEVEFGSSGRSLTLMFSPGEGANLGEVVRLLQSHAKPRAA